MIDWFRNLDETNQIAVITIGSGVVIAMINGIFSVFSSKKNGEDSKYIINQKAYDNATQIGIQITDKKEGE